MKSLFSLSFLILCLGPLYAQNNANNQVSYSVDTLFPFNIPLLDIDSSTVLNSKTLLAIPRKEKEKKPTVIAFWLTTCMPCKWELDTYTAQYADWKKQANFNFYAISTDFPRNFRKIASIAREKKYPFEVFWDRDHLFRLVMPGELNGLPQIFIFDKNGKMAYHHKGFRPGDELTLIAKIKELQ